MTTPYDGKILLVYTGSAALPGLSITGVATRIRQKTPNAAGILLKVINGARWQGAGNSQEPKAITGPGRLADWVEEFNRQGLEVHVWGVPRASRPENVAVEARLYVSAANVPGVRSLLLDVEHGPAYWQGTAAQARALMEQMRAGVPAAFSIGLTLDGRRNRPFSVFVDPFIPFVDTLHPQVYPILFGSFKSIGEHLDEAFGNLAAYDKPIVPVLQAFVETTRRPTPAEITLQGHLAFSRGAVGVAYFRLGDDLARLDGRPHPGDAEYAAIAAVRPTTEAQAREERRRRLQTTGRLIGIHGAPGAAAPSQPTWDTWIGYLKEMGVRWYKQCDHGDPNDLGPGTIFRWVLRLRDEGITPIIRYLQAQQFPGRLLAAHFQKMKRYAQEGVLWAEIGNEPNLDSEWQNEWRPVVGPGGQPLVKVSHTNPEVIRLIAENWVEDAEAALAAGAKPAFYAFAPTDWRGGSHPHYSSVFFTQKVVQHLAQRRRQRTLDIFQNGGWIAVHAATYEQPVDFDPFGQGPVVWDMTLRSYEVVLKAFQDAFGDALDVSKLVVMSTEGGVFTKDSTSMNGHLRLRSNEEHAARVVEMFEWLELNSPLQAMCPWCLSVGPLIGHFHEPFQFDGWIEEINGRLIPRPVIPALSRLRRRHELAGRPRTLLDVPYLSQWDETAQTHRADSGPTCLAMLLNAPPAARSVTVDALYQTSEVSETSEVSPSQLVSMATRVGLALAGDVVTMETAIGRVKELISEGRPFIVLVNTAEWEGVTQNNSRGRHYVVVVGFDDENVYVHDPSFTAERWREGEFFAWPYSQFLAGWGGGPDLDPPQPAFLALIPTKTVPSF
ncbi:MAG: C39 family peptidase [Chloroflexota bacterium]